MQKLPINEVLIFLSLTSLSSGRSGWDGIFSGSKLTIHLDFDDLVGMKVVVVNPLDDLGLAMSGKEDPGVCFVTLLKLSKPEVNNPKCD